MGSKTACVPISERFSGLYKTACVPISGSAPEPSRPPVYPSPEAQAAEEALMLRRGIVGVRPMFRQCAADVRPGLG